MLLLFLMRIKKKLVYKTSNLRLTWTHVHQDKFFSTLNANKTLILKEVILSQHYNLYLPQLKIRIIIKIDNIRICKMFKKTTINMDSIQNNKIATCFWLIIIFKALNLPSEVVNLMYLYSLPGHVSLKKLLKQLPS